MAGYIDRVTMEDVLLALLDAKFVIEEKCLDEARCEKVLEQLTVVLDNQDLPGLIVDHIQSIRMRICDICSEDNLSEEQTLELERLKKLLQVEKDNLSRIRKRLLGIE